MKLCFCVIGEVNTPSLQSTLDVFLLKYPQAIEEIFNSGITTNGQDLDSVGLQIIFNFDFFFKEGLPDLPYSSQEDLTSVYSESMTIGLYHYRNLIVFILTCFIKLNIS